MTKFYLEKGSGYIKKVTGEASYNVEPIIVQPTPEGMEILAQRYCQKYQIDLRVYDGRSIEEGDQLIKRFEAFKAQFDFGSLSETRTTGIILSHGQNHVVPLLFSQENGQKFLIIFDSTSGTRMKGYYPIANLFPDYQVLLNFGTRQADDGSCVADALSILKDALRMPELGTYLTENKLHEIVEEGSGRKIFFGTPKPNNFKIFLMPEELLKTAQISKFVENSNPDLDKTITKNNETLGQRRQRDRTLVSFNRDETKEVGINAYLHKKSQKYRQILDQQSEQLPSKSPEPTLGQQTTDSKTIV
jgi:hypothetical protein